MCSFFGGSRAIPPDPPPASISLRTYHVAQFFLPCDFSVSVSPLSLLVGCSLSLYFYLLFRLLSIPRIPCRCCDEYILTRTKSLHIQMSDWGWVFETCKGKMIVVAME